MADKAQMTVPLSKMISELAEKHEMPKKKLAELFGDFIEAQLATVFDADGREVARAVVHEGEQAPVAAEGG